MTPLRFKCQLLPKNIDYTVVPVVALYNVWKSYSPEYPTVNVNVDDINWNSACYNCVMPMICRSLIGKKLQNKINFPDAFFIGLLELAHKVGDQCFSMQLNSQFNDGSLSIIGLPYMKFLNQPKTTVNNRIHMKKIPLNIKIQSKHLKMLQMWKIVRSCANFLFEIPIQMCVQLLHRDLKAIPNYEYLEYMGAKSIAVKQDYYLSKYFLGKSDLCHILKTNLEIEIAVILLRNAFKDQKYLRTNIALITGIEAIKKSWKRILSQKYNFMSGFEPVENLVIHQWFVEGYINAIIKFNVFTTSQQDRYIIRCLRAFLLLTVTCYTSWFATCL